MSSFLANMLTSEEFTMFFILVFLLVMMFIIAGIVSWLIVSNLPEYKNRGDK